VLQERSSTYAVFIISPTDFAVPGGNRNMLKKDDIPIKVKTNNNHHGSKPIPFDYEHPQSPSFLIVHSL